MGGLGFPYSLLDRYHPNIDSSFIFVDVRTDPVIVTLAEKVWSSWSQRFSEVVTPGNTLEREVEVNSGVADGVHRLAIYATDWKLGADVRVGFESFDY
jgi:hypothetical protein